MPKRKPRSSATFGNVSSVRAQGVGWADSVGAVKRTTTSNHKLALIIREKSIGLCRCSRCDQSFDQARQFIRLEGRRYVFVTPGLDGNRPVFVGAISRDGHDRRAA